MAEGICRLWSKDLDADRRTRLATVIYREYSEAMWCAGWMTMTGSESETKELIKWFKRDYKLAEGKEGEYGALTDYEREDAPRLIAIWDQALDSALADPEDEEPEDEEPGEPIEVAPWRHPMAPPFAMELADFDTAVEIWRKNVYGATASLQRWRLDGEECWRQFRYAEVAALQGEMPDEEIAQLRQQAAEAYTRWAKNFPYIDRGGAIEGAMAQAAWRREASTS